MDEALSAGMAVGVGEGEKSFRWKILMHHPMILSCRL